MPKEVLVPDNLNKEVFEEVFKIKFMTPIKGEKKKILDLAYDNARIYYEEQMTYIKSCLLYTSKMYKIFEEIYYSRDYNSIKAYHVLEEIANPFNKIMLNEYIYNEYKYKYGYKLSLIHIEMCIRDRERPLIQSLLPILECILV